MILTKKMRARHLITREEMRGAKDRDRYYGASDEVLERMARKQGNAARAVSAPMIVVALISALVAVVLTYLSDSGVWSFDWLPTVVMFAWMPVGAVGGIALARKREWRRR